MTQSADLSERTFDLQSNEFRIDPHATLHALRDYEPVHFSKALQAWVITSHRHAETLLNDRERFYLPGPPPSAATDPPLVKLRAELMRAVLVGIGTNDSAAHARIRKVLQGTFTPRAVEQLRFQAQAFVDERIDAVMHRGAMDVVHEIAIPLPMFVLRTMLGIPEVDAVDFSRWAFALIRFGDPTITLEQFGEIAPDLQQLFEYARRLVSTRRAGDRGNDLLSSMIADQEADRLSEDELVATVVGLIAAGTDTTQNAIGFSVLALLDHPEQRALLAVEPSIIPNAVEELLRYTGVGLFNMPRLARAPTELGGKRIEPGQLVLWSATATSRDPAVFSDPDRLDLRRQNVRHLTFGQGPRHCLGAALARMELQVALATLSRRLPYMKLAVPRDRVEFRAVVLRGPSSLPVTF